LSATAMLTLLGPPLVPIAGVELRALLLPLGATGGGLPSSDDLSVMVPQRACCRAWGAELLAGFQLLYPSLELSEVGYGFGKDGCFVHLQQRL
jgi:hypothetical protein